MLRNKIFGRGAGRQPKNHLVRAEIRCECPQTTLLSRSFSPRATAGLGHEDPFPRTGPNGRCRFGQETFAEVRGMGETRRKRSLVERAEPTGPAYRGHSAALR